MDATKELPQGLIVTAKQTYYPIELSNAELLAHYETIQDYHQEISANVISQSCKFKPDPKLIDQQPEMNPHQTREQVMGVLFELSVKTRVTNGIFFHAARLYDRYCSKRVVLREQAKLVIATCLWLAAKTWGGCNHIINNVTIPTGGRFYGPNPRARIPRLSELVHYCGGSEVFDESMFMQMERHILDTLNWDVYEPMINDYVLNVDENCLIQYELYKKQLEHNKEWFKRSEQTSDSDATEEDEDEDEDLDNKIRSINIKKFLIDLSTWQYELLKYEMFEIAHGIFSVLNKFTKQEQGPLLMAPLPTSANQTTLLKIFISAVADAPQDLIQLYKECYGVLPFIATVREHHTSMQKKMQYAAAMDLSRRSTLCYEVPSMPSPPYPNHNYTPMRNVTATSDTSIFSTVESQPSPVTPIMYSFPHNKGLPGSSCGSTLSVNSITNKRSRGEDYDYMDEDKENQDPTFVVPPRAKFVGNGIFASGGTSATNSNRSSLVSLAISNINNMV
ncbi:LAFE_0C02652g1_1 [Lachancea fermentati]|uniref:G1/S-specific cyclin n=1 Tax=Lachancea fermentati TaxID=4955 RepID=A0A1G4M9J6_LACFM|nr:LAFE_0C02652g1_1 [Lachancea fermentati]